MTATLAEIAVDYARAGVYVVPCKRSRPLVKNFIEAATTDENVVREYWSRWPTAQIGCVPYRSGELVIDVDPRNCGDATIAKLESEYGPLPRTKHQRSGGGGEHIFLRVPDGFVPRGKFPGGIDVKWKGVVILAPSPHKTTRRPYEWISRAPSSPIPETWCDPLRRASRPEPQSGANAWRTSMGTLSPRSDILLRQMLVDLGPRGKDESTTWRAVLLVHNDFGLGIDDGRLYLDWWNRQCGRPVEAAELDRQTTQIEVRAERRRGCMRGMASLQLAVERFIEKSRAEERERDAARDDTYGSTFLDLIGSDEPDDSDEDAWIVSGVVAAGAPQVIAGHPKSRKTFVAEHLALCIAAGIDWVGKFKTTQGRALVLAREDTVRETRRRIWRLARGLGLDPRELADTLRVDSTTPFYFDDADDVDRMRRTIESWRPTVIFIDSLSRTHTGDENSKKDMSVVTNTWGDLCNEYGVAVSIIHHLTKSGEGTLLQRLRGSGDIGAVLRHMFEVQKEGDVARLEFDGNLHPLPAPFTIKFSDEVTADNRKLIRLSYEGDAGGGTPNRIDGDILAALASAGAAGMSRTDLRHVKGKGKKIDERTDALVDQCVVEKIGGRFYLAGGMK